MSENIIDMVKGQLGGSTLDKLSSFLGESSDKTQTALGAAIPTLLAGFSHTAATPEGAEKLHNAALDHENTVANFGDSIAPQGASIANQGSMALTSLLGGGTVSGVSSVIGRFAGLKSGSATSLMGLCAPLLLGVLGKYQRSSGLNAAGLSGFLTSQKQNIAGAMPAGLGSLLSSIPGFSSFGKSAQSEIGATEKQVYDRGAGATSRAEQGEPVGAGGRSWAIGVAALVAAIVVAWAVTHRRPAQPQVAQNAPMMNEPAGAQMPQASTTVKANLNDTLSSVSSTLKGITDQASADKAEPQLNQLNTKLAGLRSSWDTLPTPAKTSISSSVQTMSASIPSDIARIRAIPGVGDKLKPTLDQLEKLVSGFSAPNQTPNPVQ